MKKLTQDEIMNLNGGDVQSIACALAFEQLGAWNAVAFGLAGMFWPSILIPLTIGVVGAVVCAS